jgi:hypothetical protein
MPIPSSVTVFAYQVGFGDCLLIRFEYPTGARKHVLIDFGSMKLPKGAGKKHMLEIAQDIRGKCGAAGLEAVVATHRHADHISGFATNAAGTAPGDVIASLEPKLVLQPWTEHPDIAEDAIGPASKGSNGGGKSFARALAGMQAVAAAAKAIADGPAGRQMSAAVREQIRFIGEDNIKNPGAVRALMKLGRRPGAKPEYLYFGARTQLGRRLPGVKVHVLGPPTVAQHEAVRRQNPRNEDEYWHLLHRVRDGSSHVRAAGRLFPRAATEPGGKLPAYSRWLAQRVRAASEEELLGIVTSLDDAMNCTSLILLFEVGDKKLLFPGDAQWENWEFALSKPDAVELLEDVNLYKVGHHGSLNATPKSMWNAFANRGGPSKKNRLRTVLSTVTPSGHGSESKRTEVPRRTLLEALRKDSHLDNTDELAAGHLCTITTIPI